MVCRGTGSNPFPDSRRLNAQTGNGPGLAPACPSKHRRHLAGHVRPASALISGVEVKEKISNRTALGGLLLATTLLAACGTPPAKDFSGSWRPVILNRTAPTEIPLHPQYTFFAAPIDGTLKAMLTRWATDTNRTLRYELNYDVTLYTPVATIRTADLEAAVSRLSGIYAAQGVQVSIGPDEIVVRSTNRPSPSVPTASNDNSKTGNALP